MIVAEQERWSSIAQTRCGVRDHRAVAQRDRWVAAIRSSGLTDAQVEQVLTSRVVRTRSPPSCAGPSPTTTTSTDSCRPSSPDGRSTTPRTSAPSSSADSRRPAQPKQGKRRPSPKLVVGLIPVADGPMSPEMAKALAERADLMEATGDDAGREGGRGQGAMAEAAGHAADDRRQPGGAGCTRSGRSPPTATATRWRGAGLSASPQNEAQKLDAARAEQAIRRARAIAEDAANAQDGRSRALEARGRAIG